MTSWRVIRWYGLDTTKIRVNFADNGAVAQLGERVVRNDEVVGSIPIGSTRFQLGRGPRGPLYISAPQGGLGSACGADIWKKKKGRGQLLINPMLSSFNST